MNENILKKCWNCYKLLCDHTSGERQKCAKSVYPRLNYREDGRVEIKCNHGIGHTVIVPRKYEDDKSWWSHGCDGCCERWK